MTPEQIDRVKRSWPLLSPLREPLGQRFYARLFELAPEARALFPADLAAQQTKLVATLHVVVENLDDIAPLKSTLEQLALRHLPWGVTAEHYDRVGAALLDALQEALGPAFDDELRTAWAAAYRAVAQPMLAAAYPPR